MGLLSVIRMQVSRELKFRPTTIQFLRRISNRVRKYQGEPWVVLTRERNKVVEKLRGVEIFWAAMQDADLTTLALGTDLTTLGLNLNSPDNLYKMFGSPWADAAVRPEPEFSLPSCYLQAAPRLQPGSFSKFQVRLRFDRINNRLSRGGGSHCTTR